MPWFGGTGWQGGTFGSVRTPLSRVEVLSIHGLQLHVSSVDESIRDGAPGIPEYVISVGRWGMCGEIVLISR